MSQQTGRGDAVPVHEAINEYADALIEHGGDSAEAESVYLKYSAASYGSSDEFLRYVRPLRKKAQIAASAAGLDKLSLGASRRRRSFNLRLFLILAVCALMLLISSLVLYLRDSVSELDSDLDNFSSWVRASAQRQVQQQVRDDAAYQQQLPPPTPQHDQAPPVSEGTMRDLQSLPESFSSITTSPEVLYLAAKKAYGEGRLEEARRLVDRILESPAGREWGRAHYFNGILLEHQAADLARAELAYQEAQRRASAEGDWVTFLDASNNLAWLQLKLAGRSSPADATALERAYANLKHGLQAAEEREIRIPNRVLDTKAQVEETIGERMLQQTSPQLSEIFSSPAEALEAALRTNRRALTEASDLGEVRRSVYEDRISRLQSRLSGL